MNALAKQLQQRRNRHRKTFKKARVEIFIKLANGKTFGLATVLDGDESGDRASFRYLGESLIQGALYGR